MADKTVVVRLALKANGFSGGLKQAGGEMQQFATQVERGSTKASSSALALGAASATAGKLIILGIGGAMVVSAKAAIDYESSLAGVAKTTDLAGSAFDRANSPLAKFGDVLRNMSLRVPVNVNDLNRIAELGGQLGVQVPNLAAFTETIAALGVTTNLSVDQAATSLARLANIMGTDQGDFARLGGIIVELGNNFATTESEILSFGLRLAPSLKAVNGSEEDVLGLAAALTSLGIPAERGGTALQRWFLQVDQAVSSGGEKVEKFAKVAGQSVEDFSDTFENAPAVAFKNFVAGLDAIQESGGSVFGTLRDLDIQEQRSIQVLLAASNGWETVASAIRSARVEGEKAGDALFEEAAKRYGTTASQVQLLANSFNDLRIEVGGAILGSGGLTASIEFFREFFGIIKDNLPLIGRLATALGVLAAMRLGATFLTMAVNAQQAVTTFLNAKNAIDGVTRSMAAAKLAALGLNTALFGALAIVGILAVKWANAAREAAELTAASKALNDELVENGVDPYEAIVGALEEANILTDERKDALLALGISERDFVDTLLGEKDALGEVTKGAEGYSAMVNQILENQNRVGESGAWNDVQDDLFQVEDLLKESSHLMDSFFQIRRNDIVNQLLETGQGANRTREQLDGMAQAALDFLGINATDSSILDFLAPNPELADKMQRQAEESKKIINTWLDTLSAREDGPDQLDDFFGGLGDVGDEFVEGVADTMAEVEDAIRSGFPVWDEYEKVTIESLEKVLAAQDQFIEDMRGGLALGAEIADGAFGEMSGSTLEWFNNLDTGTQGALARMNTNSSGQFATFIRNVDENMREMDEIVSDQFERKLPGVASAGMTSMIATVQGMVADLKLSGEQSVQALLTGMEFEMLNLPLSLRPLFASQMAKTFDLEALKAMGITAADGLILGFIEGLGKMSGWVEGTMNAELAQINKTIESKWEIDSPSKVSTYYGEMYAEGIKVGFESRMGELGAIFSSQLAAFSTPVFSGPAGGTTNNSNRSVNIEINHPSSGNLGQDLQLAGMVATQQVMAN